VARSPQPLDLCLQPFELSLDLIELGFYLIELVINSIGYLYGLLAV
jgi:hypothetical protein